MRCFRFTSIAGILIVSFVQLANAQTVERMLPLLPDDANVIGVLKITELINSQRGINEGWAEEYEKTHLQGSLTIPPWVTLMVRASYVRPGTPGGDWTAVVIPLPESFTMAQLATREKSDVQSINALNAVFSSQRNGYFIEIPAAEPRPRALGGIGPSTRQDVGRWIEDLQSAERPQISDYLQEAASDDLAKVIYAIDLENLFDPAQIRYRLSGLKSLKNNTAARETLTIDLQTIRGARLSVYVDKEITAGIQLDFNRKIGDEATFMKDLLIEFLNDAGASLEELEDATVQTVNKSVIMRMPLTDAGLRRILSLITTTVPPDVPARASTEPNTPPRQTSQAESNSSLPNNPRVDEQASLRYYKAVNQNIEDLQKAYRHAEHYRRTAQWHDNFARKIENLPITGVDPALVDYGQKISNGFRALASSLRGTGVKVDSLNAKIEYDVNRYPVHRSGFEAWVGRCLDTLWAIHIWPANAD